MKLGLYWVYATRSLMRGGQRTLLAIFCVVVGVMAIVSLQLVGAAINQSLTGNVRDSNGGDISVTSALINLRADQLSVFDQLQGQGKITQYTALSGHDAQSDARDGRTQYFELRAVDPGVFPLAGQPTFLSPSGATLASTLTNDGIVLTQRLADNLGVIVGDNISITSDDGRVVDGTVTGIVASAGYFQRPQALVSFADYSAIASSSGLPVGYSAVYLNVPDHSDANANSVKSDIGRQLPTATVTTTKDALQQRSDDVQNIRYFLQVVGLLSLLIGGVGIVNTMQVLLRRRQTEIAVLKTTGYRRGDLYALFGLEAGLLGLLGGVIGSAAGLGVSMLVRNLVVERFFIDLPVVIDPGIIASGVLIGVATALIFGLMPIVQAAQIRPLAVLRGVSEGGRGVSWLLTAFLFVLLIVLFFGLTYSILGNFVLAFWVIAYTGAALAVLSGVFYGLVFLISHFPIPERLTWWYALLALAAVALGVYLVYVAPAFGALALALAVLIVIAPFLPRTSKANTRMALRNLGRESGRSVTTMVALFVGVFGIGLILALGQNIKDEINTALSQQLKYNSFIIAGVNDKTTVDQQVAQAHDLQSKPLVTNLTQVAPIAVNDTPIGQALESAPDNASSSNTGRRGALFFLSAAQGFDLANGSYPDATLMRGANAVEQGRLLNASDANTLNVIMPYPSSLAPLNLKVGDTITLASAVAAQQGGTGAGTGSTGGTGTGTGSTGGAGTGAGNAGSAGKTPPPAKPITLHVVGFYTGSLTTFAPILADQSVVDKLAQGTQFYIYGLEINPAQSDQVLHEIKNNVKSVRTFSVVDLALAINTLLNNLIIVLTAIASLAMVAGVIIIANAVGLAMLERRREIGILKSVGYTSGNIQNGVLVENGMIGFTGSLVAMLIVTLANFILNVYVFKLTLGAGWQLSVGIVGATTLICMLVAAVVAYSAARVRPLEVLRYE
ncbi:MAG TPA: FtsX-like permease family protein [Ktedonobacterales bacterium]|nr:FtsX-like permease family protein [Ktedonobacterales bacterium]